MSRDYPPLTRKKQKIKDAREWVVAKYSYIYAIVIFAVAVLGLLLGEEAGLFIAPILAVAGLPFLVAAMNCRITMNTQQITVRNFFRVCKTYSFGEIESWRENTHYVYLYPVNGRRICIRREDDVDERLKQLISCAQNNGAFERKGVSDSKLYWGNCSRPIKQTVAFIVAVFIAVLPAIGIIGELITVSTSKEDLQSHTFIVTEVREVEDGFQVYDGDVFYTMEKMDLIEGRKPTDLVGTKISVLVDEVDTIWELIDRHHISWYTFEEYQGYLEEGLTSIVVFLVLFNVLSLGAATYCILVMVAYHAPHKHPRMYEYFETTNIGGRGRVYTFTGLPPQKGNK